MLALRERKQHTIPASVDRRRSQDQSPAGFFKLFRMGESLKILLTIVLFVTILLLKLPDLRALPLFAGYALVLVGHWSSLIMGLKTEVPNGS